MDRDRHLLFGVLAVQFEQLSAPEFVHAAGRWAANPSEGLADVLVREGILTAANRNFVNKIVHQTMEDHGGDASTALTALGGAETVSAASNGLIRLTESGVSVTTPGLPVATPKIGYHDPLDAVDADDPIPIGSANWKPSALIGIGVGLLIAVGGTFLGRMDRERRDATVARGIAEVEWRDAERARAEAERELANAITANDVARADLVAETRARSQAETQLGYALNMSNTFIDTSVNAFGDISEAQIGLRSLLESNASSMERIIDMERDPTERDRWHFLHDVGLGARYYAIGDFVESIEAYERALASTTQFAPALAQDDTITVTVAESYARLGASYRAASVDNNAVNAYETAIERFESILTTRGSTPALSLAIANAYNGLANALIQRGTVAATPSAFHRSLEQHRALLEANILTAGIHQDLQFDDALTLCNESVTLLSAMDIENPDVQYSLAIALDNYGVACGNAGLYDVAESSLEKSFDVIQGISVDSTQRPVLNSNAADVLWDLGVTRSVRGEYSEGHTAFQRGLSLMHALTISTPDDMDLRGQLASFHHTVGSLHLSLGENQQALAAFVDMLDAYQCPGALETIAGRAKGSTGIRYRDALAKLRHSQGGDESIKLQAGYIELLRYFVELSPEDAEVRDLLVESLVEYGIALRRSGDNATSLVSYRAALENLQVLLDREPAKAELKSRFAEIQRRIDRTDEAL
jgi:tetratricopeptide (TPR) repeat protein